MAKELTRESLFEKVDTVFGFAAKALLFFTVVVILSILLVAALPEYAETKVVKTIKSKQIVRTGWGGSREAYYFLYTDGTLEEVRLIDYMAFAPNETIEWTSLTRRK